MFYGIRGAKFSKILSNLLSDMVPAGELGDMVEFDLAVTASETKADRSAISGSVKGAWRIKRVFRPVSGAGRACSVEHWMSPKRPCDTSM